MADDARAGDPAARAAFDRGGTAIGIAVASVVQALDLSVVVVGGGLAGAWDLLEGPLSTAYDRHAGLAFARAVPVVPTGLGPGAGLVGAAALVLRGEAYWHGDG
jgi:glucokinase